MQNDRSGTVDLTTTGDLAATRAKLVVLEGNCEGTERALEGRVEVGTDPACHLTLSDRGISRRHALFSEQAGRIVVRDLESRNGTYVGGSRIVEAIVPIGTIVKLGNVSIGIHPRWYLREVAPATATEFGELYGKSAIMREIFAILERVAATDVTLLIEGESGTGKELVARSVHRSSARADNPYVVFDCAAVAKELADSELFGHKRGAFSGAVADRAGAFQQAHGGTIFLDEIGELPLDLQPKLLRVLETGNVRRVGDDSYRKVDVRVIAATNRDLQAEVRRGRFRGDLLYRIEVVKVVMPPLRHRPEDIAGLVERMVPPDASQELRFEGPNASRLMNYSWPGNARELRNVVDRAYALAARPKQGSVPFDQLVFNLGPAECEPATLGFGFPGVESPLPYKQAKEQLLLMFDDAYVNGLLRRHRGNMSQAAAAAGLSRKHLYELVRRARGED